MDGGLPSVVFLFYYKKFGEPKADSERQPKFSALPVILKLWLGFLHRPLGFNEKLVIQCLSHESSLRMYSIGEGEVWKQN